MHRTLTTKSLASDQVIDVIDSRPAILCQKLSPTKEPQSPHTESMGDKFGARGALLLCNIELRDRRQYERGSNLESGIDRAMSSA